MNIKTTLNCYYFNTEKPAEAAKYHALLDTLLAMKLRCFTLERRYARMTPEIAKERQHADTITALDGQTIELETEHLFDNQWNTAPVPGSDSGLRLFDWCEYIFTNGAIKKGYWLTQTAEMREVRRNTMKCHYCGKQEPAAKGYVFCPHCLDSPFLKSSDLYLTRLAPVDAQRDPIPPLSEAERAHLLPLYREAQIKGNTERGKARLAKMRADLDTEYLDTEYEYREAIHHAETQRAGFLWFMDRGIQTDNLIYYKHTKRFCFGWRAPVDAELVGTLLDVISEFPYAYEIKTADGRTLQGG